MKRSIFSLLLILLICVAVAGFYRGWFTLTTRSPDAGSNKVNVNLSVDPDKMKEDAEAVKKKTSELAGSVTGKANESADPKKSK